MRRCRELRSTLASVYRQARRRGVMRRDIAAEDAALGTCVFITGLIRLWLMDSGASVLRPQAEGLIAAHVATLRCNGGVRD